MSWQKSFTVSEKFRLQSTHCLVLKTWLIIRQFIFKDYDVILLENHGVIVGGKDIKETYLKLELCEAYAQTLICSNLLGGAKIIPEEEVKKIYSLR